MTGAVSTATVSTATVGGVSTPDRATPSLAVGFVLYLALVVWAVLWKLHVPWIGESQGRVIKLVPFVSSATNGPSDTFDVVANLALFVPIGVYLGLLARSWAWWAAVTVLAGTSLTLEVLQYTLAIGSTDITDVIVNTSGGVAGLALGRAQLGARASEVLGRLCSAGTLLALIVCGIAAT